jgi:hypothetical protein
VIGSAWIQIAGAFAAELVKVATNELRDHARERALEAAGDRLAMVVMTIPLQIRGQAQTEIATAVVNAAAQVLKLGQRDALALLHAVGASLAKRNAKELDEQADALLAASRRWQEKLK